MLRWYLNNFRVFLSFPSELFYQSESLLAGIFRPCKFIKMMFNKVIINPLRSVCIPLRGVLWMIMRHPKWSGRDECSHKHTHAHNRAAFNPCGSMWLRIITKSFHSSRVRNHHDSSDKTDLIVEISQELCFWCVLNCIL